MTQTRSRIWLEVAVVVVTLAIGGAMMYALIPFVTAPNQVLVPPPKEMPMTQTLLMVFVAMTAIGAPLTAGIVLALVFRFISKRVSASSSVAPEIPAPQPKPRAATPPKDMSAGDARVWKIVAALLLLAAGSLGLFGLASLFVQFYK